MVFLRSLGVILQFPVLAGKALPIPVRVGLCVCLASLLGGSVKAHTFTTGAWELGYAAAGEVALGLALGFVAKLAFTGVDMAGRIMSSEIGLMANPGMGIPEPNSEPLAAFLSSFAVVLFFLFGGHYEVISALGRSFTLAPAGAPTISSEAPLAVIKATGHVLELGLRIAAPFIAINYLVTLAFSFLSRAVPKTNVFVVSYSARTLLGLALLSVSGSLIAQYLFAEFSGIQVSLLRLIR